MSKSNKPAVSPTPGDGGAKTEKESPQAVAAKQQFLASAANMGWQLAVAVLVPVVGGAELDRHAGGTHLWLFVGLAVALLASIAVMRRAIQLANRLPVPKLTAAQKRQIQKQYEEDDADD